ncbi:Uncharacterised protein [Chlamydia abortus]|nr:Uncharacterised protein [Chlamydia abortus]
MLGIYPKFDYKYSFALTMLGENGQYTKTFAFVYILKL